MTLTSDQRERLLALIRADSELRSRLDDQLEVTPDEDVALSRLLGRAFTLAETGDPLAARLVGLHRVAVAEPEITTPSIRPLTIHEGGWLVGEVKALLPTEPELSRALSDRQRELEAAGQPRADAAAIVATELLRMSADGQKPLGGHSELARAVRICAQKIANGTWRPEPPREDLLGQNAGTVTAFDPWRRSDELHDPAHVTRQPISGPPVAISRHDEPELQRPSVIVTADTAEGGEAA